MSVKVEFSDFQHKYFIGGIDKNEKLIKGALVNYFKADKKTDHQLVVNGYFLCSSGRMKVEFKDEKTNKPYRCFINLDNNKVEDLIDIKNNYSNKKGKAHLNEDKIGYTAANR
jgi:hypothetical protein